MKKILIIVSILVLVILLDVKDYSSTKDDIRRVVYVQKGTRPPFKKLFEKQKWNPETKTGIKEFDDEYFMTMYYEH